MALPRRRRFAATRATDGVHPPCAWWGPAWRKACPPPARPPGGTGCERVCVVCGGGGVSGHVGWRHRCTRQGTQQLARSEWGAAGQNEARPGACGRRPHLRERVHERGLAGVCVAHQRDHRNRRGAAALAVRGAVAADLIQLPAGGLFMDGHDITICSSPDPFVLRPGSSERAAAPDDIILTTHLRSAAALSRSRRLSISICFSPAPLTWPPPPTRSRWDHMRVRRGSW